MHLPLHPPPPTHTQSNANKLEIFCSNRSYLALSSPFEGVTKYFIQNVSNLYLVLHTQMAHVSTPIHTGMHTHTHTHTHTRLCQNLIRMNLHRNTCSPVHQEKDSLKHIHIACTLTHTHTCHTLFVLHFFVFLELANKITAHTFDWLLISPRVHMLILTGNMLEMTSLCKPCFTSMWAMAYVEQSHSKASEQSINMANAC